MIRGFSCASSFGVYSYRCVTFSFNIFFYFDKKNLWLLNWNVPKKLRNWAFALVSCVCTCITLVIVLITITDAFAKIFFSHMRYKKLSLSIAKTIMRNRLKASAWNIIFNFFFSSWNKKHYLMLTLACNFILTQSKGWNTRGRVKRSKNS